MYDPFLIRKVEDLKNTRGPVHRHICYDLAIVIRVLFYEKSHITYVLVVQEIPDLQLVFRRYNGFELFLQCMLLQF